MKKIISYIALSFVAAALAASCTKYSAAEISNGEEGLLHLGVNVDSATRAAMTQEELVNSASVKIYYADFRGLIRQYIYSAMPQQLYLPAEDYRVDIVAGKAVTDSLPSWEQKSYTGSKEFTIVAKEANEVTVNAKICNVVTKIAFDDTIEELFNAGYTFSIGTDETNTDYQLVYNVDKAEAPGYFIVAGFEPSLYWKFSGVLKKDDSQFDAEGEIKAVEPGKMYSMTLKYTEKDGDLEFTVYVDRGTTQINDDIEFKPVSTGLSNTPAIEVWAGHAPIYADVDESEYSDPTKIKFAYTKAGQNSWTTVDAIRKEEGVYYATMTGLSASTEYEYKLVINNEKIGESKTLTTEAAPQVPNPSFETVSNTESNKFKSFYDPSNPSKELQTKWWDSGNVASASYGYEISVSSADVPNASCGTKSALLQSKYAVVKLAAGNLFSGEFAGLQGLDGKVNFGRPFTGRPTGVRFWMKYKGGGDLYTKSGYNHFSTSYDEGQIKFALGTWNYKTYGGTKDCPVQVYTGDVNTFWNFETITGTIAYCDKIVVGNGSMGAWQQVTLQFDYKNTTTYPTHIIISGAASRFGDYYEGSASSEFYIDNIELLYE